MKLSTKQPQSVFESGFMTQYYTDKVNKKKRDKLSNSTLTRIATVLGRLSKEHDLYDLLFDQPNQLMEVDRIQVNTKDLMAFVLLDHTYTRGYFAKAAQRSATSDTTNSQGVPLALEGAKRLYNKSYMSWLDDIDMDDYDSMFRVDVFLPAELGSFGLGANDEIVKNDHHGILVLYKNKIVFSNEIINSIREEIPNWITSYRPKMLDDIKTIEGNYGGIFNSCSHKLRSMLLQGWVWQPTCRSASMICNTQNWDEFPSAISYEGMRPKGDTVPGLGRFT